MPGRATRQIGKKKLFQPLERPMTAKSIRTNAAEPSYFYLVMAESYFRRAVSSPHPKADATLRKIGRDYLAMANHAPSIRMRNLETSIRACFDGDKRRARARPRMTPAARIWRGCPDGSKVSHRLQHLPYGQIP
jgi:hypothetical protein